MQKKNLPLTEVSILTAGELIVSLVLVGIYCLLDQFSYRVVTGTILGSTVTILNFVMLSVAVNRALDRVLVSRGEGEMTEEDAEKFATEHMSQVQQAVKASYIVRTILMLAALVAAFLLDCFDVIATLVPLLMFRPIITISEIFRKKKEGGQ